MKTVKRTTASYRRPPTGYGVRDSGRLRRDDEVVEDAGGEQLVARHLARGPARVDAPAGEPGEGLPADGHVRRGRPRVDGRPELSAPVGVDDHRLVELDGAG